MTFLEKDLEDVIFENINKIYERGLVQNYNINLRQFKLPSGKRIDIFSYKIEDGVLQYTLYELKREVVDYDALLQIIGYAAEINMLCKDYFSDISFELVLIGRKTKPMPVFTLTAGWYIHVFTYSYDYDGIRFDYDFQEGPENLMKDWFANELLLTQTDLEMNHKPGDTGTLKT